MPPKHVYGKRSNRAAMAFKGTFLSPDKEETGNKKNKETKKKEKKEEVDVGQELEDVEARMGDIKLDGDDSQDAQDIEEERIPKTETGRKVLSPRDGNEVRRRDERDKEDGDVENPVSNETISNREQENKDRETTVAVDSTLKKRSRRPKKIRPGKAKIDAAMEKEEDVDGLVAEKIISEQKQESQPIEPATTVSPQKKSSRRPRKLKDGKKSGDGTAPKEQPAENPSSSETISEESKEVDRNEVTADVASKPKISSKTKLKRKDRKEKVDSTAEKEERVEDHVHEKTISEELQKLEIQESTTTPASPPPTSFKPAHDAADPHPVPPTISTSIPSPSPQDIYTTHISPLLPLSNNPALTPFTTWSSALDPHFHITKIAEASYGEVYRLSLKQAIPGLSRADESVLKLIAIKPPPDAPIPAPARSKRGGPINLEAEQRRKAEREDKESWMSDVAGIRSEVQLLSHLSPIPGFTNFRDLVVLQGRPDGGFVRAWREFNRKRPKGNKSIFPDPGVKRSYDEGQLWAVIEMQDAGCDLERWVEGAPEGGGGKSIWEVWDVFWGVAVSVAKGEGGVGFEHRDLHLGNICIRSPTPSTSLTSPSITLTSLHQKLHFTDLETTIIDYTLSRANMTDPYPVTRPSSSSSSSNTLVSRSPTPKIEDVEVAYMDLDRDPALFEGNAEDEYQYEIYRYMRSCVYYDDPLVPYTPISLEKDLAHHQPSAEQKDIWRQFHPRTNLLWLHFLLHKLLQVMTLPSSSMAEDIVARVSLPQGTDERKVYRKALKLEKVLRKVERCLEPGEVKGEGLRSTAELVAWALGEGWLGSGDVRG